LALIGTVFQHTDYALPLSDTFHANGNEAEVIRWARHFGVFEKIKDPCRPGPRWAISGYSDHPTHWIVFTRVWGHPKERENGWFMYLYPKSTYLTLSDCEERSLHLIRS
jgi:hypothetical protein